ncbi:hypothetical protein MHBO_005075 [Bonamia ostreae]|uniref:DUF551 domain-containing protein n=1 Tax=Bonamia ostreae TaxID=126728 RepID=A0ABV2AV36_9EUKA
MSEQRLIDANDFMAVIKKHDYLLVDDINSKDVGMFTIGIQQAVDEAPTIEPPVPQWTSVEIGLPEDFYKEIYAENQVPCVTVTNGYWIAMAYHANDIWVFAEATNAKIKIDWTEITHWMPLPKPPKEETK